jgi:hypothetical protein
MLVGYMRVSSDNDRQTTDLQRDALLDAGVDPRQLFADKASGARDDRPGLQQALAYVQPGDCLIGWKLDRLGRSLPHLLQIVTTLQAQGVAFRSLTEQMDTTPPQGAFLFSVFGALAQYERALTQERIKAGLAAAKRRFAGPLGSNAPRCTMRSHVALLSRPCRERGIWPRRVPQAMPPVVRSPVYHSAERGGARHRLRDPQRAQVGNAAGPAPRVRP